MVNKPVYLSDRDVAQVLTTHMAIEAVRDALLCHARGDYEMPLKPYLYPRGRDHVDVGGRIITMPARLGAPFHCAGVKHIAGFPSNRKLGLPRASGMIILNNLETGMVPAVMDCSRISTTRTAAVAALSYLHLGTGKPASVAICGAGPIAAACIEALSTLTFPPRSFSVYDLDRFRAKQLATEMDRRSIAKVNVCDEPPGCVEGAEVLITATTAKEPYLRLNWLKDCRLVVALSFEDCEPRVLLSSKVIVDDWDQCCREDKLIYRLTNAKQFSRDRVHCELGEIIAGRRPGRESGAELVYVNPMGMAIEDIALAWRVYEAARGRGLGLRLPA